MKRLFIRAWVMLMVSATGLSQPARAQNDPLNNRSQLSEKIDTTGLDLKIFAQKIVENYSSNYQRAEKLLDWLANRLQWVATDYKQRTVKEILARGGGNCFELAKVYMALIKELNIQYRQIAEINIHQRSETRQQSAAEKVSKAGFGMSVFGLQHNDHRWVEIYDDRNNEWMPADPSMNVIGTQAWLKARVWFGYRQTIDTSFTNDMIVPFAIYVVSTTDKTMMTEDRSHHYLVKGFNELYDSKLSALPSWSKWVKQVEAMAGPVKEAFAGKVNLHTYAGQINELTNTYAALKQEFMAKYK